MHASRPSAVLVSMVLGLGGCIHGVYEIELSPTETGLHRELTFYRAQNSEPAPPTSAPSAEEIAAVQALYGSPVTTLANGKQQVARDFTGDMPQDIGGAGWHWQLNFPGGTLRAYTERFRGQDDLGEELDGRQRALDRLVELTLQIVDSQVGDDPIGPDLKKFVDGDLRRDARNLSLYLWSFGIIADYQERAGDELGVRIVQYLIERDYVRPQEALAWQAAFAKAQRDSPQELFDRFRRTAARKSGVPDSQPIPPGISRLLDSQQLNDAATQVASPTEEYQRLLAHWERERPTHPELERPAPTRVFEELAAQAFLSGSGLFSSDDQLHASLRLPVEPFSTNGTWEAESNRVTWSRRIASRDRPVVHWPRILFAFWCEPDRQFQQKHFGSVLLNDAALVEYATWFGGLSSARAKQWSDFLVQLGPTPELAQRIKAFRFTDDPPVIDAAQPPESDAHRIKILLIGLLASREEGTPQK